MNKSRFLMGVAVVALGIAVFAVRFGLEHSLWGLRGLLYAGFGIYIIRDSIKKP